VLGIDDRHIYHLFVAEKHQNTGVARQLLLAAQGLARGFSVNSSVFARGFYEKMGFVAESDPLERNGILTIPMKLLPGKLVPEKIILEKIIPEKNNTRGTSTGKNARVKVIT